MPHVIAGTERRVPCATPARASSASSRASRPSDPCRMKSRAPLASIATTGRPAARASSAARPNDSRSLGSTNDVRAPIEVAQLVAQSCPASSTRSPTPELGRPAEASRSASGPSPGDDQPHRAAHRRRTARPPRRRGSVATDASCARAASPSRRPPRSRRSRRSLPRQNATSTPFGSTPTLAPGIQRAACAATTLLTAVSTMPRAIQPNSDSLAPSTERRCGAASSGR